MFYLSVVGTGSTRSSVHRFQSSKKNTVEVGQGNLKLTFSTTQGKMINFVNSRSLVCNAPESSIVTCYLKFILTFSFSMNFFENFVFLTMIKSEINVFVVAEFHNSSFCLPLLPSPSPKENIYKKIERQQEMNDSVVMHLVIAFEG